MPFLIYYNKIHTYIVGNDAMPFFIYYNRHITYILRNDAMPFLIYYNKIHTYIVGNDAPVVPSELSMKKLYAWLPYIRELSPKVTEGSVDIIRKIIYNIRVIFILQILLLKELKAMT